MRVLSQMYSENNTARSCHVHYRNSRHMGSLITDCMPYMVAKMAFNLQCKQTIILVPVKK